MSHDKHNSIYHITNAASVKNQDKSMFGKYSAWPHAEMRQRLEKSPCSLSEKFRESLQTRLAVEINSTA